MIKKLITCLCLFPVVASASCDWAVRFLPANEPTPHICVGNFAVGYDKGKKTPKWALYRIYDKSLLAPIRFRSGLTVPKYVAEKFVLNRTFFKNLGLDHGHLAPERQIVQRSEISNRFADVNRVGMIPTFNRKGGLWALAEDFETDAAVTRTEVIGMSGIVPGIELGETRAFYKILIYPQMQSTISFLFPHDKSHKGNLGNYITSIACIEKLTGTKLFTSLDRYEDIRGDKAFSLAVWTQGNKEIEGCGDDG